MDSKANEEQDPTSLTKTEEDIQIALNWVIAGIDDEKLYQILMERGLTPAKAKTIMRWAAVKARNLGWI